MVGERPTGGPLPLFSPGIQSPRPCPPRPGTGSQPPCARLDAGATDHLVALLGPVPRLRDLAETDGLRAALTQLRNPDDCAWIADLS
ncbi:hypothetical protein GCM10023235_08770 [Kitasatospora terrestris]|uniref:Uncharacterized protein n=1 Tax=Kitasatospora terrestris TaxID=258051 RepID=A0ABP9DA20_9ACTN